MEVVDAENAFTGLEICTNNPGGSYVNGVDLVNTSGFFYPNSRGLRGGGGHIRGGPPCALSVSSSNPQPQGGRMLRRHLAIAATLAVLASLAVLIPGTSANAYIPGVPPCYGPTCVGKSPYIQNHEGRTCVSGDGESDNGAKTIGGVTTHTEVNLRWSAFCAANWAQRVYGLSPYFAQSADGHIQWGGSGYSDMVDGTQLARVCISEPGATYCSGWE